MSLATTSGSQSDFGLADATYGPVILAAANLAVGLAILGAMLVCGLIGLYVLLRTSHVQRGPSAFAAVTQVVAARPLHEASHSRQHMRVSANAIPP